MSHDAEHRRLRAGLAQLAKAMGMKWEYCEADNCSLGRVHGYGEDDPCEECMGAGEVLVSDDPCRCSTPGMSPLPRDNCPEHPGT